MNKAKLLKRWALNDKEYVTLSRGTGDDLILRLCDKTLVGNERYASDTIVLTGDEARSIGQALLDNTEDAAMREPRQHGQDIVRLRKGNLWVRENFRQAIAIGMGVNENALCIEMSKAEAKVIAADLVRWLLDDSEGSTAP